MKAIDTAAHAAMAVGDVREHRVRRAAVAQRLLALAPDAAAAIGWDMLDQAPAWLALPEPALATFQRQIGALLHAPDIRLWIDGARLNAVRAAVGDGFLRALLAQRDGPPLPPQLAGRARIDRAEQVRDALQSAGAAVLYASVTSAPLRDALTASPSHVVAAPLPHAFAESLVARVLALVAQVAAAAAATPTPGARS